jgi:serralysin
MRKSYDAFSWNSRFTLSDTASYDAIVTGSQFARLAQIGLAATPNMTIALPADGIGDDPAPSMALAPTVVTTDNVPDTITGTNPTITVGGPHIISTIDTPGDQDFFQVELQAGVKYNIGMYGAAGGPSGVPQPDAFIELYDAAGNLIAYEDGNGRTPSGELYGLDAMLTITVATTGTYYINARAFEQDLGDATTTGDTIGDYDLFVEVNTDPPAPVDSQYYSVTSPLRSIDWGTQVDATVRNPDGDEGTAPTGNPAGTPDNKGETVGYWGQSTEGKNVIKIYFAKPGDVYTPEDPSNPGIPPAIVAVGAKDYEITAVWISLREFEKVADVVYVETQNRDEADFHYVTYSGTPGSGGTPSLLGSMSPPQEPDEGLAQFNSNDYRWNATNLQQGGFSFVTLIHEFGHGHGLAHPHDTGGDSTRMPGVKAIINTPAGPVPEPTNTYPNYTRGDYDLNQGVFTMMSYQDGWETSPYGRAATDVGYGYLGGLMALDIAVIQSKYGVNEEWATGDDVYTLKDVNEAGTFYSSIWDGGGIDEIRYTGARNSNIDLRSATLKYEIGGGGWVSYATGIHGGFTIANGATIENATSGSGNDTLRGNLVGNRLDGGAGNDILWLVDGGDDDAIGGEGDDVFLFGGAMTSADKANGGAGSDQIGIQGNYAGANALTFGTQVVAVESMVILPGNDTRFGDPGTNFYDYSITMVNENVAPGLRFIIDANRLRVGEDFTFNGSAETDGSFLIYGGGGTDNLTGGSNTDVFLFGAAGQWGASDVVDGGGGIDQLALRGNYTIVFGATQLISIEQMILVSAHDTRFGALGADYSYNLTMDDGNVLGAIQFTLDATNLRPTESLTFDGSAEQGGSFRIFAGQGADSIIGSQQGDILIGHFGGDNLTGGAGVDIFRYRSIADSTPTARDEILDFTQGETLDLAQIDAIAGTPGNDAFLFIGSDPFHSIAGELRAAVQIGSTWVVQGDTDGNGAADFEFYVTVTDANPINSADFIL